MQFRKLYIKNFLSIREIEIEFEENRCYHIKGKNNIGKSNFLKAFKALTSNVSSRNVSRYILDGEESFYLECTDFDNNVIRLSRGKEDYYSWVIDGVEGRVDSTAGKVPDVVKKYFNMYVDEEKTKEVVNMRMPRSRLLFIDTTNGDNYFLLQKALRIEEYLKALKLGDGRRKVVKKEVEALDLRLEELDRDVSSLSDYTQVLKDLEMYEKSIDLLEGEIREIAEVLELADAISVKERVLGDMTFDFDAEAVKELADTVRLISEVVEKLDKIETSEMFVRVSEDIESGFKESFGLVSEIRESLENTELIDEVLRLQDVLTNRERFVEGVEELEVFVSDSGLVELVEVIREGMVILSEANDVIGRVGELKRLTALVEEAELEKKTFMEENKFCPACGSTFEGEHVHD